MGEPELLAGTFEPPPGHDATDHVRSALARVPWRHEVRVRVRCPAERVEALFPPGLSLTVEPVDDGRGWVRVGLRAERLDRVPAVLAGLPVPFVVETPGEPLDGAGHPVEGVRP